MRRLLHAVVVALALTAVNLSTAGCGPVKVNAFTCEGSIAQPHASRGKPGWMLAKARARCFGNGKIRYVEIRTQMQQKVAGDWVTLNNLVERKNDPKVKQYYTVYTADMRCKRGTFRARMKASGKLVGGKTIVVEDNGWIYSNAVKNPCGTS